LTTLQIEEPTETLSSRAWARFRRHRLAIVSTVVLAAILLLVIAAPLLAPRGPTHLDVMSRYASPSSTYLLGTDRVGRDVWARVLYGGRVSLSVSLVITGILFTIGILAGAISGYAGGAVDVILQRTMEIVNAMPALIIVISIAALTGDPNIVVTMVVLGLLGWGEIYRFVRGQILSLREEDFVLAARSIGVTTRQIVLRHVLPNVIPYLIVQLAFSLPGAILTETSLSFLGLGVQEPTASWGNVVGAVRSLDNLEKRPWMWLPAGFLITLTVLCINFIGDALRDALDPRALIEK
jgi:peptide/nickel transport system permease protein